MKGKGRQMLEEWSLKRFPTYTQKDGTVIVNPNVRVYKTKPNIKTKDWTDGLKWDEKKHKIIHVYAGENLYLTSYVYKELTRAQCLEHLQYIKNIEAESCLDTLLKKLMK